MASKELIFIILTGIEKGVFCCEGRASGILGNIDVINLASKATGQRTTGFD
ncbi:hypothetical protein [Parendozoicomonas sp. Alg238-R29]|uniref:hypothetical protein n=1 Tax=Parendozoicomonas sp. Alg238-R29 TaxID=2993446 RepID=UPI00248E5341|nr:hypothetical protein [Parendozoicomonas sp. Alg238-R29]